jgi:hypothetical protein
MRDEFLNQNLFYGLRYGHYSTARWRDNYNDHRPHSALKNISRRFLPRRNVRHVRRDNAGDSGQDWIQKRGRTRKPCAPSWRQPRLTVRPQVATLEERCNQQQETLGYFRADLRGKSEELTTSRSAMAALQQELREARRPAASAESAIQELHIARQGLSLQRVRGLLQKAEPRTGVKRSESRGHSNAIADSKSTI